MDIDNAPRFTGRGSCGRNCCERRVWWIGCGACACACGYHVTITDRCARLGARAQVFERDGFRHDAGPTVITTPFPFEDLFALFSKKMSDYVTLVTPDPWYHFHFSDGATLHYGPPHERTEAEIAHFNPTDVAGFRRLIAHSNAIYDVALTKQSNWPFHSHWFMIQQIPICFA